MRLSKAECVKLAEDRCVDPGHYKDAWLFLSDMRLEKTTAADARDFSVPWREPVVVTLRAVGSRGKAGGGAASGAPAAQTPPMPPSEP